MDSKVLKEVLRKHKLWLEDKDGGECANLHKADLQYADLENADLSHTNLEGANLQGANLSHANLKGANLRYAYLRSTNLSYANLRDSDLRSANLQAADLEGATLPDFQIEQNTALTVYKKITKEIITLEVPIEAKRTVSLVGNKCRAEFAKVTHITNNLTSVTGGFGKLTYTIGETIYPDSYNDDIRQECTNGIHFFITKEEAENY